MTQKAITIKDLAEQLNISVSTVSRALKDNPEISQATRRQVQELAKQLGFRPDPIAVALKTHKSYTIGIIVPQIVNSFFASVVRAIEEVAESYGYNVLVSSSNEHVEKEKKNVNVFLGIRVDGIIISLARETTNYDHIKAIKASNTPLVLFDRTTTDIEAARVVANDADAACKIVQHLIDGGAKSIALITGPEHLSIGRNRMKGYLRAMTNNNLDIRQDYILRCKDFTVEAAYEATSQLLDNGQCPDAFFGINDEMVIGAMKALKERNIRIPDDVTLFGFSNSKRSRYMSPTISTIDQFPHEVGTKAAELLFEQILAPKYAKIREEVVNCELLIRESSDKNNKR